MYIQLFLANNIFARIRSLRNSVRDVMCFLKCRFINHPNLQMNRSNSYMTKYIVSMLKVRYATPIHFIPLQLVILNVNVTHEEVREKKRREEERIQYIRKISSQKTRTFFEDKNNALEYMRFIFSGEFSF